MEQLKGIFFSEKTQSLKFTAVTSVLLTNMIFFCKKVWSKEQTPEPLSLKFAKNG
jgi:hypothetical protein